MKTRSPMFGVLSDLNLYGPSALRSKADQDFQAMLERNNAVAAYRSSRRKPRKATAKAVVAETKVAELAATYSTMNI